MPTNIEQILDEFVNREREMDCFRHFLNSPTEYIFVVWGDGGVGKSSLQAKMVHEIAQRKIPKAEVIWFDSLNRDYLAFMRKVRDDLSIDSFKAFTELANFFTVPHYQLDINVSGNVSILKDASIEGAQFGDVTAISIKDFMLSEPRTDISVPEEERCTRLTDAFFAGLKAFGEERPAIIFLDAAEKMTSETRYWLWEQLLATIIEKKLNRIKFVICGRKKPELDRTWKNCVVIRQLYPLEINHIKTYLRKRGIEEGVDQLAKLLAVTTCGNMLNLATAVDAYLTDETEDEDGW